MTEFVHDQEFSFPVSYPEEFRKDPYEATCSCGPMGSSSRDGRAGVVFVWRWPNDDFDINLRTKFAKELVTFGEALVDLVKDRPWLADCARSVVIRRFLGLGNSDLDRRPEGAD